MPGALNAIKASGESLSSYVSNTEFLKTGWRKQYQVRRNEVVGSEIILCFVRI
jgi:hypothetical protein